MSSHNQQIHESKPQQQHESRAERRRGDAPVDEQMEGLQRQQQQEHEHGHRSRQQQQEKPQFEFHSSRYEYTSGGGDIARYHGEQHEDTSESGPRWKAVNLDLQPDGRFTLHERAGRGRGEEASQWQRAEGNWKSERGRVNFKVERQESKGLEKARPPTITGGQERLQRTQGQQGEEPQHRQGEALVEHGAEQRRRGEHLRGLGAMQVTPIDDEFSLALNDLVNTEPFVSPLFRVPLVTNLVPRFLLEEFRG